MAIPKSLFLNICRDEQRRVWGVARICLADGSCLVIESKVYTEQGVQGRDYAAGGDESPKNKALDDALDKLCIIAKKPGVKQAIPLPARVALQAVCKARNLAKIKAAVDNDPAGDFDEDEGEEAGAELQQMRRSRHPIEQRALAALRLWD